MSTIERPVSVPLYLSAADKRNLVKYRFGQGYDALNRSAVMREILEKASRAGIDFERLAKELRGLSAKPTHKLVISKKKQAFLLKTAEGVGKSRSEIHLILRCIISGQMYAEGVGK